MLASLRVLAVIFLLVAVLAAVTDVTYSMAGNRMVITSLLEHWAKLAPQASQTAQASLRRLPLVWDFLLKPALSLPAWGFFLALGILCAWGGRRRSKVNIFAN